jgi:hypothetical protein
LQAVQENAVKAAEATQVLEDYKILNLGKSEILQ